VKHESRPSTDFSRREFFDRGVLRLGSLSALGLTLPSLLAAESSAAKSKSRARAKSCIFFFMEGGPAHQDLWDMKPEAPLEYRGEFKSIPTKVPGVHVCEHLPLLAKQFHHFAQVRSIHHDVNDHNAGAYYCLTGRSPKVGGGLIVSPSSKLFPAYGSVVAKLRPTGRMLPDFVHIPEVCSNLGYDLPGQFAGFLGKEFDPYVTGDPSLSSFDASEFELGGTMTPERFQRRRRMHRALVEGFKKRPGSRGILDEMEKHYEKAFSLLGSKESRQAFDLSQEPQKLRDRYGFDHDANRSKLARDFGGLPHLGQSMLLARRLIEAGVRLVTVCTGRRYCQAWDTHRKHFPLLKRSLLPMTNRAFSALIEDMDARGLLADTLVVAMGEFGRTPKIGQVTSGAGADRGGRDHWPPCYTALFAGAGIHGGAVYGASDRFAAYPAKDPVTPGDIAATIYWALGLDPDLEVSDHFGRPQPLARGTPIKALFS
jgi:hypothetical protein